MAKSLKIEPVNIEQYERVWRVGGAGNQRVDAT
jgi:hypothetical protein